MDDILFEQIARDHGVRYDNLTPLPPPYVGMFRPDLNTIQVLKGMPPKERFAVFIHELAHAICFNALDATKEHYWSNRCAHEWLVEEVSRSVCEPLGIKGYKGITFKHYQRSYLNDSSFREHVDFIANAIWSLLDGKEIYAIL